MNKLGRNKTLYLKRQGCVFKETYQPWQNHVESHTTIFTEYGEYIGLANLGKREDTVNFIYKHRLTNLMSINRAMGKPLDKECCNTVSIGFNEKEQKWYGWTHRGYGAFGIGYEVKQDSIMANYRYPFKVETLEQAKELAIFIADYLD